MIDAIPAVRQKPVQSPQSILRRPHTMKPLGHNMAWLLKQFKGHAGSGSPGDLTAFAEEDYSYYMGAAERRLLPSG